MADAGWDDGFLALGNLSLPGPDGRPVGVLTVKGDAERIRAYPAAFRRALANLNQLFADSV